MLHLIDMDDDSDEVIFKQSMMSRKAIEHYLNQTDRHEIVRDIFQGNSIPDKDEVWEEYKKCKEKGQCPSFRLPALRLTYQLEQKRFPYQYNVNLDEVRGLSFIALRQPLTLLIYDLEKGKVIREIPLYHSFPERFKHIKRLFLHQLIIYKRHLYNSCEVARPMTFSELQRMNPDSATRLARNWLSEKGEDIQSNAIVGDYSVVILYRCSIEPPSCDKPAVNDPMDLSSKYGMIVSIGGFYSLEQGFWGNGALRDGLKGKPVILKIE